MIVVGEVTQSEPWKTDDSKFNVSIEGFSVIPSDKLPVMPKVGDMITATIKTVWKDKKRYHFLNSWKPAQVVL
jgi:hypothetical protein